MKSIRLFAMLALTLGHSAPAEPPARQVLSLTAKAKVLESDSDLRGRRGSSRQKTLTLRVEITNTSSSVVESTELTGQALVRRAGDLKDQLIKESLGAATIGPLKPNQKVTIDLGKIELHELEWRARKFEESFEEWQVVCKRERVEIAKAESGRFQTLLKDAVTPKPANKADGPRRKAPAR